MITPERASLSESGTDGKKETDKATRTEALSLLKVSAVWCGEQETQV